MSTAFQVFWIPLKRLGHTLKEFGITKWYYTMAMCNHHQPLSSFPKCEDFKQVQPTFGVSCLSNTKITYGDDKTKAKSSSGIRGVDKIKTDIYTVGKTTGASSVYENLLTYKNGV